MLLLTQNPLTRPATTCEPTRTGQHIRRAGLGVWASQTIRNLHVNPAFASYQRWKLAIDDPTTSEMAAAIAALIREWCPFLPSEWVIITPPQGASEGRPYPAGFLAKAVAALLDLDCLDCIRRAGEKKTYHGALFSLKQQPFTATSLPRSAALIVDDFINTGTTMRLSLAAMHQAGCAAFGFAWGAA